MKLKYILILFCLMTKIGYTQNYPFQNTNLDVEKRIDNLISLMTLDEKIECLSTTPSVPRLVVMGTGHVEGLHGLAMGEPGNWGGDNPVSTTIFPQSYGLGETWDTTAIKMVGEIEGYDVRYMYQSPEYHRGALVVRAPNADLSHDPRWGRTEECYGEDPFLNGSLVVSYIDGLQGNDKKYWMAAALMKHFLANSNEDTRTSSSSDFDDRLLHEYYAYPFEKGVRDGGSRAFMAAYNKVNQIPMMVSPLLKDLAIKKWGQNGIICTDGGALKLLISDHKYYESTAMGAAMAVKAGITQFLDSYREDIETALKRGYLAESDIDAVLRGNFRVMIKLGLLDKKTDNPYSNIGLDGEKEPWLSEKNKKIVRGVTQKSIVLLKNNDNLLPIQTKGLKKIVVVGRLANEVLLDWYSGSPPYEITPMEGIKKQLDKNVNIVYLPDTLLDKAKKEVKDADLVFVFGGNHPTGDDGWAKVKRDSYGKEAVDRKTIQLEDETWIKQLYEVNQNMVFILISSFPYAINWSQRNIPAIIQTVHSSQELGNALADVIFGRYNPAGRLVQDWPMCDAEIPPLLDYNIRNGHTYMYDKYPPLYPFGYGLSYTSFDYTNLNIELKNDSVYVSLDVQNTGKRDGDEVIQVYAHWPESKVERPRLALKGFVRTFIKRNEMKHIEIPISNRDLSYWNETSQKWIFEKGEIQINVGASSKDIRLVKDITVK